MNLLDRLLDSAELGSVGEYTFAEMAGGLRRALPVSGDGWALFGQRPECTRLAGPYDENIWPPCDSGGDSGPRAHASSLPRQCHPQRPTIALCMIVRDEAAVIARCLESVRPLISCWRICDTGSQDGTPALISQLLGDLPGALHRRPWRDFGWNRSELMELAAGCADYLLLIDADMTLVRNDELPPLVADAYLLRHLGELEYAVPRLVRGDRKWRFEGATHEYLTSEAPFTQVLLEALAIEHYGDGGTRVEKFVRDVRLLEAAVGRDPADARSTFYLAQTLREAGEEERAIELYRRRVELGGWDEEVFYAAYQLGVLVGHRNPDAGIPLLQDAHELRPTRAEPLYELARLSRLRHRHRSAYMFAHRGALITKPEDILFVHRDVYEWGMRFEQAVAAYWLGHYHEALELNETLLAERRMPSAYVAAVERNRNYCLEALGRRSETRPFAVRLAKLLPDLWHREIHLDVDSPWPQFNPSVASDGDGFRMIVRTANYRLDADGGYDILDGDGIVRTMNYLVRLDDSLRISSVDRLEDRSSDPPVFPSSIEGWEDLRLFKVGERWLATANVRDRNPEARAEVALLELDGPRILNARVLKGPDQDRHEKNWMPFVHHGRLHLVYSCGPTVVYECDLATGDLRETARREAPGFAAALRGGSAGVRVNGGWLFAVHEAFDNRRRAYLQRFVLLDDDFRLAAASLPFRFGYAPIEICLGLASAGNRLILSYGENDASAHLAACSIETALKLLEPCDDLEVPTLPRAPSSQRLPIPASVRGTTGYSLAFESFGLTAEVFSDDGEMFELLPLALPPVWRPRDTAAARTRFGVTRDGIITVNGWELMRIEGGKDSVLSALSSILRDHVAQHARAHVFVHAGVVRVGAAAIVIPGSSHTGKTTLVAELVRAGAVYYSDEYAVVDRQGLIHSYPKPLSIRTPESGHFAVSTPVPDSKIGTEPVQAGLIVMTRYCPKSEWRPTALAPGEGALGLLQHTVAVRARPRDALRAARDLAQTAPAIEGPRGEASAVTTDLVERVHGIFRDRGGPLSTRTLGGRPD